MKLKFFFLLLIAILAPLSQAQDKPSGTGQPDRSLPPKLSEFLHAQSQKLDGVDSSNQLEFLDQENRKLKQAIQELQFERIETLLQEKGERANVLRSSIWQNRTIEVHWENPEAASDEERRWVKDAVSRTWEQKSQLRFVGWDKATASSSGIRIRIAEDGPHCKRLGSNLNGMVDGMVLNFTFRNWCPACGADRKGSIEKIAVHEFGHALGFAHEQNRTDAPDWCKVERQGSDGDWYITIYDPDSIMNYCNPRWNNDGLLSDLDIRALQLLYGTPNSTPASAAQ